ncbi:MAG: formylglycine-generating enzyme family protein, partial [Bacteroidota bacterium]
LDEVAWYSDNSQGSTHPVKEKKANELGLYDMSGNVWEWCQDWFKPYPGCSGSDYTGSYRVVRGGSWDYDPRSCRVAGRGSSTPDYRGYNLGFRLARTK